MSDVNTILATARNLPAISDAEIQKQFSDVQGVWAAKAILAMSEAGLRAAVAQILAGDAKEGLGSVGCDTQGPDLNGRLLQFNTMSDRSFRGHRVAKKQNGQYALFGHDSTYRHVKESSSKASSDTGKKKPWWKFW